MLCPARAAIWAGGCPAAVQSERQRLQRGPQHRRLAEAPDGQRHLPRPVQDLRGRAVRLGWAGGVKGVLVQDHAQLARVRPLTRIWPDQHGRNRGQRLGHAGPRVGGQGRPFHRGVPGGLLVPGDSRGLWKVPCGRLAGQRIEVQAHPGGADKFGAVAVGELPGDERL
jgi:hypothetical protein